MFIFLAVPFVLYKLLCYFSTILNQHGTLRFRGATSIVSEQVLFLKNLKSFSINVFFLILADLDHQVANFGAKCRSLKSFHNNFLFRYVISPKLFSFELKFNSANLVNFSFLLFKWYFFASAAYIVTGWWEFYLFKIFEINE